MTGFVSIFLAIVSGLMLGTRRQLVPAILPPMLAVLVVQTWGISTGRGVSPPSTVNRFPDLVSYYVVQLVIFGLAFGAADQLRLLRARTAPDERRIEPGRTRTALLVNAGICLVAVACFELDRPLFDPGNVKQHASQGSPPVLGLTAIGLTALVFLVLGAVSMGAGYRGRARAPR
jgi:hypothetical protein